MTLISARCHAGRAHGAMTTRVTVRAMARAACAALTAFTTLAACGGADHPKNGPQHESTHVVVAPPSEGMATGYSTWGAQFVTNLTGFRGPEAVLYDPAQDVYFVSNMSGYGSDKDARGYITRINAKMLNQSSVFAQSGKDGVRLDAPKGMALQGDTLWVADIDVLRGFNRLSGKPVATIDLAPYHAVLLNDLDVGPDGSIWISDTGILMNQAGAPVVNPGQIFVIGPGHSVRAIPAAEKIQQPNGIRWDPKMKRWVVVSYARFAGNVVALGQDGSLQEILRTGTGQLDGLRILPSGAILFSSWADSSVHLLANGHDERIVQAVPVPASIGLDTHRDRLLIPMSLIGWVQVWDIGPSELRFADKNGKQ